MIHSKLWPGLDVQLKNILTKNPGFYQVLLLFNLAVTLTFFQHHPWWFSVYSVFQTASSLLLCHSILHPAYAWLLLHIPFQNTVASSAFNGFALSSLPSRFLKNVPWLVWKFLLSWNCFILLSYCFTFVAFAVILFQFFHYQCKPFSSQPMLLI